MQRVMVVVIGVLVVVGGVGYLYMGHQQQTKQEELRAVYEARIDAQQQRTEQLARDLAHDFTAALAGGLVNEVVGGDSQALQDRIVAAVKGRRVARIIVLDPEGAVLASTDLRYTDGVMEDPLTRQALTVEDVEVLSSSDEGEVLASLEVAAPVRVAAQKVAVVRVAFELGPEQES
jgi:hypothetical protein